MKRIFPIIILFCLVFGISAKDKKKDPLIITGNNVKSKLQGVENGKKIYLTELTGNPRIKYGNNILRARKIIIRGDDGEISEAIGNVVLIDKKSRSRVTSQKAIYYKFKNMAEFTGRPKIITRKKEDNSRVTIKADRIEYFIDDKTGYAYGNIALKNKETNIYSKKIIYKREDGVAIFIEEASIRKGEDIYTADEIIYHIDKKSLILNKNAQAITYSEEKDSETGKINKIKTIIEGDRIENYDENEKLTIIIGNESEKAKITKDDTIFTGNRIEIRGEEGEDVRGEDVYINYIAEDVETNGKNFKSHKKEGRSALWGDALMIIKDEVSKEESSRIYGDYMEFFEEIDELHIFGNISILSDSGIIRGDMARYLRSNNNMYVTGNAMIEEEDSILYSQQIIFNTKTNDTTMVGNIKGNAANQD